MLSALVGFVAGSRCQVAPIAQLTVSILWFATGSLNEVARMDGFDYETALSLGTAVLALTLVAVLVAANGPFGQIYQWRDRLQISPWRWPLNGVLVIALAFVLWQVIDALLVVLHQRTH